MFVYKEISASTLPKSKYLKDEEVIDEEKINEEIKNPFAEQMRNLVCDNGYLRSIYDILPKGIEWITGWEISKILYGKILEEKEKEDKAKEEAKKEEAKKDKAKKDKAKKKKEEYGININGFFGNKQSEFILGFLYYASTVKSQKIDNKHFIYNNDKECLYDIDEEGVATAENKKFESTVIDKMDTVDFDELTCTSPSICRYINNYVRANSLYLNFSILESSSGSSTNSDYDIRNILPTIFNLHDDQGILLTSFPSSRAFGTLPNSKRTELFVYTLSCMFKKVTLLCMPWESKIWALCCGKNKSFDKIEYIDMMESAGYKLKKIQKKYKEEFEIVQNECAEFDEDIQKMKNTLDAPEEQGTSADNETLIKDWLQNNEKYLDNITLEEL